MYRHYSPYHRFSKQAEMDYSQMLSPFASEGANKALYAAGGGLLGAGAGALLSKLMGGSALKGGLIGGGLGAGAGYFGRGALQDYLAQAPDTTTDSARMNALRGISPDAERRSEISERVGERIREDFEANQRKGETAASREAEAIEAERVSQLSQEQGEKQKADRAAALADPNSPESLRQRANKALMDERSSLRSREARMRAQLADASSIGNTAAAAAAAKELEALQQQLMSLDSVGGLIRIGAGSTNSSVVDNFLKTTGLTREELATLLQPSRK